MSLRSKNKCDLRGWHTALDPTKRMQFGKGGNWSSFISNSPSRLGVLCTNTMNGLRIRTEKVDWGALRSVLPRSAVAMVQAKAFRFIQPVCEAMKLYQSDLTTGRYVRRRLPTSSRTRDAREPPRDGMNYFACGIDAPNVYGSWSRASRQSRP